MTSGRVFIEQTSYNIVIVFRILNFNHLKQTIQSENRSDILSEIDNDVWSELHVSEFINFIDNFNLLYKENGIFNPDSYVYFNC